MRLGHPGGKEAWEKAFRKHGLEISGAIADSRAGEQHDTYFINYPPHSDQSRKLEFHLGRGNARNSRHCLRIYCLWDDISQQVVVGWLPSHLDTRYT